MAIDKLYFACLQSHLLPVDDSPEKISERVNVMVKSELLPMPPYRAAYRLQCSPVIEELAQVFVVFKKNARSQLFAERLGGYNMP